MCLSTMIRKHVIVAVVALWIPVVGLGIGKLLSYSNTPGPAADAPDTWPVHAAIPREPGKYTLVMFVHPQCPCSRASLGELAIIMAHSASRITSQVLMYRPVPQPNDWSQSESWQAASIIPGVRVAEDRNAEIARAFGAYTSGQTLVYDPAGRLVFRGGITASRGHSGDNPGRGAITALLHGNLQNPKFPITTRVFGCSLRGE